MSERSSRCNCEARQNRRDGDDDDILPSGEDYDILPSVLWYLSLWYCDIFLCVPTVNDTVAWWREVSEEVICSLLMQGNTAWSNEKIICLLHTLCIYARCLMPDHDKFISILVLFFWFTLLRFGMNAALVKLGLRLVNLYYVLSFSWFTLLQVSITLWLK